MKRRSFFKALAGIIAAVAIAPEIAFRAKLELPEVIDNLGCIPAATWLEMQPAAFFWQTERHSMCIDNEYEEFFKKHFITRLQSQDQRLTYSPSSTPQT